MIIESIKVTAEDGITEEEIQTILLEEKQLWKGRGRTLGEIELAISGDEIVVKSTERSAIKRVRRITGYLSTEDRFNDAKHAELKARVAHD